MTTAANTTPTAATNPPRDWVAKDLGKYTAKDADQEQQSAHGKDDGSAPVEVQDMDKLYATIDTMLPKTQPKSAAAPKKKTLAKKSVAQK